VSGEPSDKKTRIGTGARAVQPATGAPITGAPVTGSPSTGAPIAHGSVAPAATPPPGELPPNIPAAGAPPAHTDPLLGQTLAGRYLIHKKLGEGGMGAVYYAQHTVLEKPVALKVLHGEFARKGDLVQRFMQEAKAASRIRHENVIDISDFGSTPEGLVFFAMELLQGHDLHEDIARHRLGGVRMPWQRSRGIFLQICSALAAAHGQGVVHRDLKPENIYLVEWLGHRDFVKLLDFGIAKLTEVADGDRKLTRTGMLFGTPEYMSPEQARGDNVDHRVDIYAMGCILYQLVTGRVPFEAENFMGILSMHLTEEPPPIPPPVFAEIGAPPGLADVIAKALAKDRNQRYQTVDDLANAVRTLDGEAPRPVIQPQVPVAITRQRTQWTGNLAVPTEDDGPAEKRRSPAPWIALGAMLLVGGGVAAFVATRGGTPAAAVAIDAGVVVEVPPAAGPVPARVTIAFDSQPPGADIYDSGSKEVVGQTPFEFEVPGGREPRRYTFRLAGHAAKMIELVPDENVAHKVVLTPVKGSAPAAEPTVEVVPQKGRTRPATRPAVTPTTPDVGPTTRPDAPDGAPDSKPVRVDPKPDGKPETRPETRPDTKPETKPEPKPDVKPETKPDVKPTDPDDDDTLEIKQFPPAAPVQP
jgi:serine/threonine-protein kinase